MNAREDDIGNANRQDAVAAGRDALARWRADRPANWFTDNSGLRDLAVRYLPEDTQSAALERLAAFGAEMVAAEAEVERCNLDPHLPQLARWDGIGRRTEEVVFDPSYHTFGARLYGSGVMGLTGRPERAVEQAALVTLASHHGEAGHVCPVACTAGMIGCIEHTGHDWLKERYLPGLTDPNYATKLHGSQFLTEVQGGSDVGSNACRAELVASETSDRPAIWRIHGEKWFCSVIDASLFLITARPEGAAAGSRGLGLFLVPRDPRDFPDEARAAAGADEGVNAFTIRRLKDKLGTRGMASGELDWNGSLAWQLGPLDRGIHNVVGIVLNTSRLFNAMACAGAMWRTWHEAATFARNRDALRRGARGDGEHL